MDELRHLFLFQNQDTNYIENYSDRWTVKLVGVTKFNYFRIKDNINNTSIRYRPDRRLNLGIGASYKWFALDITFNVGISEKSDFKNDKFFDFQGTIFSSKHIIMAAYQYYYGYQMTSITGVPVGVGQLDQIRSDLRTVFFSLQYLFAFNYKKFSLKAPFIQNELQKKSAGSFLLSAGFNNYTMDADSSVVPDELKSHFEEKMHLTSLNTSSLSIGGGYIFTFVYHTHFYLTLGGLLNMNITLSDYSIQYRERLKTKLTLGASLLGAIGYNSTRFFGGITLMADSYRIKIDNKLSATNGLGKAKIFFGYRF